jgi:hypothetical protein
MKLTEKLYEQFMSNVSITSDECWLWKGGKVGVGYGLIYVNGEPYRAHRLAVTLFLDPNYDPSGRGWKGDFVLHDCDTPSCVSPHCVKIGTASQNIKEAFARGRKDRALEISRRMKGNTYGLNPSAETKAKLSAALLGNTRGTALKGIKKSAATRAKMSAALVGNINGKANKGRKLSSEWRAKLSRASKRAWKRKKMQEQVAS